LQKAPIIESGEKNRKGGEVRKAKRGKSLQGVATENVIGILQESGAGGKKRRLSRSTRAVGLGKFKKIAGAMTLPRRSGEKLRRR